MKDDPNKPFLDFIVTFVMVHSPKFKNELSPFRTIKSQKKTKTIPRLKDTQDLPNTGALISTPRSYLVLLAIRTHNDLCP